MENKYNISQGFLGYSLIQTGLNDIVKNEVIKKVERIKDINEKVENNEIIQYSFEGVFYNKNRNEELHFNPTQLPILIISRESIEKIDYSVYLNEFNSVEEVVELIKGYQDISGTNILKLINCWKEYIIIHGVNCIRNPEIKLLLENHIEITYSKLLNSNINQSESNPINEKPIKFRELTLKELDENITNPDDFEFGTYDGKYYWRGPVKYIGVFVNNLMEELIKLPQVYYKIHVINSIIDSDIVKICIKSDSKSLNNESIDRYSRDYAKNKRDKQVKYDYPYVKEATDYYKHFKYILNTHLGHLRFVKNLAEEKRKH
ncbi:hypothetical protein OAQ99_04745 [Candidatus Kapabacteria bacterium]|nr:hypothetical protein [Candidatus Kapabacteria bacterium]